MSRLAQVASRARFAEFKATTRTAVTTYVNLVPGETQLGHMTTPRP